jgi:p-hydroxybenzoate 3-monooxygenase
MRSSERARLYLECGANAATADWSDERFWGELRSRLPTELARSVVEGRIIEKSVIRLRSFVVEPMRYDRLFLVGDAAHVVPPTGAKGLNLAASDVRLLWEAFGSFYRSGSTRALDTYSDRALRRIWRATRFSWWMTRLLHRLDGTPVDLRLQVAELEAIAQSTAASAAVAESYAGLF